MIGEAKGVNTMNKPLSYYENYRTVKRMRSMRELELEYIDKKNLAQRSALEKEIAGYSSVMKQIETDISNYVPAGVVGRELNRLTDERIFLELRCVAGMTIEGTADAMHVSRDTAYRIRRRLASVSAS